MMEFPRQMVHLSGLLFVLLAQFTGGAYAGILFLLIAGTFFIYSQHVRSEKTRFDSFVSSFERRLRGFVMKFERNDAPRPFLGAIWFYTGCGISFIIFPFAVASAACAMLALGDAISTIVGKRFGRRRILSTKTIEGSLIFFIMAIFAGIVFVNPVIALAGAIVASMAELLPDLALFSSLKKKGIIDDNWTIPIIAGFVMSLLFILIGG